MSENNDKVEKVIDKLKDKLNPTDEQLSKLKDLAKKYDGKSEDDIFVEIIKFKDQMKENMDEEEFEKRMKKLERIRPMLNENQAKKLDKLLQAFKESE
ncbi:Spy/CpxP family protein refolding chaperone [Sporosalibacterium faouarense]|uniref:Spy/CpxP family protein refolding chaperone n=1 Tax=Sporosalibacterium faouarense TaxID=516123 RepID=UPI00141CDC70|nr:Spy/CpxP family protein refolding chaperone [Sporosalibacterium faouarense]MTI49840.1 hypothetical protein [Bacillota bacterium]